MLLIKSLNLYLKKDLRTLVSNFDFSLQMGQKAALIGEEGNGKSTLLQAIYDERMIADYVELRGEIYKSKERIAYLPQQITEAVKVQSTADYFAKQLPQGILDYSEFYTLLDRMGLQEDLITESIFMRQLSGGEKIKFQLFCLLLQQPTLLFLDEPTNDLDLSSIRWLEGFIADLKIPLIFVSHDESLLERCANTIIHFEQLMGKKQPRHTISGLSYSDYVSQREQSIRRQMQVAKNEHEAYEKQMARYRQIYERVQHELRSISRQDPSAAKNLKDKMHSVKSMGRRFERQKEKMTERPHYENSIHVKFDEEGSWPKKKLLLDFTRERLSAGTKLLSQNIRLTVSATEKIAIVGRNGCGKSTLLRLLHEALLQDQVRLAYMPQDYAEMMDASKNAVDFLLREGSQSEITRIRSYLGSMNFTAEEMLHPTIDLSGGQRAKLYFSKMILHQAQVLLLDEPTRNLSPLSGAEIRAALRAFPGCIISVSHDRKYIEEVCDHVYLLDATALQRIDKSSLS